MVDITVTEATIPDDIVQFTNTLQFLLGTINNHSVKDYNLYPWKTVLLSDDRPYSRWSMELLFNSWDSGWVEVSTSFEKPEQFKTQGKTIAEWIAEIQDNPYYSRWLTTDKHPGNEEEFKAFVVVNIITAAQNYPDWTYNPDSNLGDEVQWPYTENLLFTHCGVWEIEISPDIYYDSDGDQQTWNNPSFEQIET